MTTENGNAEAITLQAVQEWLTSNEDGKKWLQAEKDKTATKGIETWRANNLPKVVEEEISKRYPAETPEQKKLKEMEQKLAQMEHQAKRATLKAQALTLANEEGIPAQLIDFVIGDDEETTKKNLALVKSVFTAQMQAAAQTHFQNGGRKPLQPTPGTKTELQELEEQYDKARGAEKIALNRKITELRNKK